jgi:CDP-diacylglycerol--glycerol-3-phosphate 3-phosphatidyltransferase
VIIMRDIYFSIFMAALLGGAIVVYLARTLLRGRARHARTDADGGSVFLNKASMEMGYWVLDPVVDALAALRITPNMVTAFSLVPAFGAGVAVAFGWFGLGCVLATAGSLCDLLDGVLARRTGVASEAGEVLDAAVDRYVEFFFLAGLVVYYREYWMVLLIVLAATLGAFMVSYSTAKAEAMGVPPPRGAMRRAERAVYLLVAAGLTPFCKALFAHSPSHALRELPIILAITIVAVVANLSAVQRLGAIGQALRARAPSSPPSSPRDAAAGVAETAEVTMITKRDTPAGML